VARGPTISKLFALGIRLRVYTLVEAIEGPVVRTTHAVTEARGRSGQSTSSPQRATAAPRTGSLALSQAKPLTSEHLLDAHALRAVAVTN